METQILDTVTGNIYCDRFYDDKTYYAWYIDCGICGEQAALHDVKRGVTSKYCARKLGYENIQGKWVCGNCLSIDPPQKG